MAMDKNTLSSDLATGLGQAAITAQTDGWAEGIIADITTNGVAGTGFSPNTISGVDGANMAAEIKTAASYPEVSIELLAFCTAIADHINNNAIVNYPGGPHLNGGVISGLDGATLAGEVKTSVGYSSVSAELLGFCTAIVDHIMSNAICNLGVIS